MVNESKFVVLLGQVWVYAKKRESFEMGRRERSDAIAEGSIN